MHEDRRLRVGLLTAQNARDPTTFSGTPYYMARALERHCEVVHLGPVRAVRHVVGRARSGLSRVVRGRRRAYEHSLALSREYGSRFARRIPPDLDAIVAPFAAAEIAFLETDLPIVYTSDATFERMVGYHPGFLGLHPEYEAEGNEVERRALGRSAIAIYPSEWAAESARGFYGMPPAKVHVIPYGANLDEVPDRDAVEPAKAGSTCRILFLGVDWERKGGGVVYEAVRLLRARGVDARFTACGSVPPVPLDPDHARVIPRLDKRIPTQERELSRLLLDANFLVLPTLNDCYGIVFCEASAHGTPSIAPRTGGVPGAVHDGENGILLPVAAGAVEYADVIHNLVLDRTRYLALVRSSRAAYEDRLNWNAWARRVCGLLATLRQERADTPQQAPR